MNLETRRNSRGAALSTWVYTRYPWGSFGALLRAKGPKAFGTVATGLHAEAHFSIDVIPPFTYVRVERVPILIV